MAKNIEIIVAAGSVKVEPDECFLEEAEEEVTWVCGTHDWTITFDPMSPLGGRRVNGKEDQPKKRKVRKDNAPGRYKYLVEVKDKKGNVIGKVDPELIDEGDEDPDSP